MADIDIYQEGSEDPQDDGGEDSGLGCDDFDTCNPDDNLTPIQKLEKYMASENIFSRQMVARSLLETMPAVGHNAEEAKKVLKAMVKLSDDPEPTVRAELMEQVPHLAMYCHENPHLFTDPIPRYLLPTVVRYLTDSHNQVRKTSQAAMLVLLEQELVDKADVEEQVCPVILELSSPYSVDDFRTEAVALMSKIAPLVGKDITQRVFMLRFAELCTDALFHVRKVCAANFGDMCTVIGQQNTEKYLLPKFYCLCEDGVWGVRKACAECFMAVACACSIDVRRQELASLFIALICDQSRWVRMAAFQALGGFISTFADPDITGIYLNEEGVLVAGNPDDKREEGPIKFIDEDEEDADSGNEDSSSGPNSNKTSSESSSSSDDSPTDPPADQELRQNATTSEEISSSGPTVPCSSPQDCSTELTTTVTEESESSTSSSDSSVESVSSPVVNAADVDMELDDDLVNSQIDTRVSFIPKQDGAQEGGVLAGDTTSKDLSNEEIRAQHYFQANSTTTTSSSSDDSSVNSRGDNLGSHKNIDGEQRTAAAAEGGPQQQEQQQQQEVGHSSDSSQQRTDSQRLASSEVSSTQSLASSTSIAQSSSSQSVIENNQLVGQESTGEELSTAVPSMDEEVKEEDYYDFTFWRLPLPEVDLDLDAVKEKSSSSLLSLGNVIGTITPVEVQHDRDSGIEVDAISTQLNGVHLVELKGNIANNQQQQRTESGGKSGDREATIKKQAPAVATTAAMLSDMEAGLSDMEAGVPAVTRGSRGKTDSAHQVAAESMLEEAVVETVTNIGSTHVLGQHLRESTLTVVNGVVVPDLHASAHGVGYSPAEGTSSSLDASNDSISGELHHISQDVIPQALLDQYLSMTDPTRAQNTDTEIARHCAYSLPAVAYTLGRKHWPCLKELYETLAADMQWKVRRTLAFSIHELAVIVGAEITNKDLVPVFNGFLRDLDEVRIGVLKHLGDFLRLLKPEVKRRYLTKIPDFLNTDNTRNWRFREELASQMLLLLDQYDECEISEHMVPIALALTEDKVCEVRHTAFRVLSGVMKQLAASGKEQYVENLVTGVIDRFAHSKQWNKRQIFAQLCHHVLQDEALTEDEFARHLLPSLIGLGHDAIPNVRIALAKTLSQHITNSEFFTSEKNPRQNELLSVITKLKNDADNDVRHFINQLPQTELDKEPPTTDETSPWGLSAFERTVHFNYGWS